MVNTLFSVENLSIVDRNSRIKLVDTIDFFAEKGKILGIVGESGSGKSLTMKSLMGIVPDTLDVSYDKFEFDGKPVQEGDVLSLSMIFQDSMSSFNPLRTIGFHLIEVIERFQHKNKQEAYRIAVDMLKKVELTQPETRMNQYPFELSGGMRQRVMIAMALLTNATCIIADEPTTALDVTIQLQILTLLNRLKEEFGLTVIIVSHDLSVIAAMCDDVIVMNKGKIVDRGSVDYIFNESMHPYTQELLHLAEFKVAKKKEISHD